MKNTAYLINCARGGIVVEDDLIEALDTGMIAGASLDCFVNEPQPKKRLITHPLVSVTPHIGAATVEAQERIGDEIVGRSEEHTSELQSRQYLVCRLLLEKKKKVN